MRRIRIGRASDNDIVFNRPSISGHHADIVIDGGVITLTDHSKNGTWVNGRKVHNGSVEIRRGDRVMLPENVCLNWKDITEEAFYDKAVNLGLTVSTPLHKRSDAEVQALGPKYGAGKMECFRQADIFVFPTYYNKECFPLVLLEAMQAGLACVSTKEAGIPAIIDQGRTGLMVEQRNSQALADAIGRMITNRQLCVQMGQEGRRKYENFFTIGAFDTRMYRIMKRWI